MRPHRRNRPQQPVARRRPRLCGRNATQGWRQHVLALVALLAAGACGSDRSPEAASRPAGGAPGPGNTARRSLQFPVEVIPVEARDVEYRVSAVGSVEAFEIVQVTARVQGVVEAVRFKEGDRVSRGEVLVEIEPERFRLAVAAGQAALEKAEAARAEAAAGLARREAATQRTPGVIPAEELETWRTRLRTATAEVSLAKAAAEEAELNLRDAFVRAPVGGIIQTRSVQTGEYVQLGRVLATLLRAEPLLLRFAVPEQDAAQLVPGMRATFRVRESTNDFVARLTHVAAGADPTTRMVSVTGEVETTSPGPRPGAFAEVSIAVGAAIGAAVVPETAVRPSERGFLAYVVRAGKAEERLVTLGLRTADGRVEIRQGIAVGDSLVVRGAEALREGATVRVVGSTGTGAVNPAPTSGGAPATSGRGQQ